MKQPPKVIYLQIAGDEERDRTIDVSPDNITWCVDRIFKSDYRYVLDKRQTPKPRKKGKK